MFNTTSLDNQKIASSNLSNVSQLTDEIKKGQWNGKIELLCDKILEVINTTLNLVYINESENQHASHLFNQLKDSLKTLNPSNCLKAQQVVRKLEFINKKELPLLALSINNVNIEMAKNLPAFSKENKINSLETLKRYKDFGREGVDEALAEWINTQKISLDELDLSVEEKDKIAPYLTYLEISLEGVSSAEFSSILNKYTNVQELILANAEIKELPILSKKILSLTIRNFENLTNILAFPENLKEFKCCYCPKLYTLPEIFPESLIKANISDCPSLENAPSLNQNLKEFICNDCPRIEFPSILNENLEHIDFSGNTMQLLPKLSTNLKKLICNDCNDLYALGPLPEHLKILDVRRCKILRIIEGDLPQDVTIYVKGCENLNLDLLKSATIID